jgi:hypothetical protein
MPAVNSPANVVYRCLRVAPSSGSGWVPGDFFLQLLASAGPQCCLGQALAPATPSFTVQGVVTVEWTPAGGANPVVSCLDASVDLVYRVTTNLGGTISVPTSIRASDWAVSGRTCSLRSPSQNTGCKLHYVQEWAHRVQKMCVRKCVCENVCVKMCVGGGGVWMCVGVGVCMCVGGPVVWC